MEHDIAVIGGGIAGISAAAAMSSSARLIVLEGEGVLAHHASGRSAALYEPRYGNPAVVDLSLASGDTFRALPGVLSPRGLMVVSGPDDHAAFRKDAYAMDLSPLTVDQARAMVPILNPETVAFAAHADHAWDIDTDLLLQGMARHARALGATIQTRARVTAITPQAGGWRLDWAGGGTTARIVVNAAGAWADQVAALAGVAPIGLQPLRRSMARIPAPPGHDPARWPMVFGAGETWYMKPDAGALIVSPAEEHPMPPHDAFADDMVLAEGLARYEEMVTTPVTRMLANWAGLRTFAPDRAPVIGFDPSVRGFFWLAGQGGYGFQTAPAAAALAADLLAGRASGLSAGPVAALSPGRFR
jgi:D-arginine dehydrogenase